MQQLPHALTRLVGSRAIGFEEDHPTILLTNQNLPSPVDDITALVQSTATIYLDDSWRIVSKKGLEMGSSDYDGGRESWDLFEEVFKKHVENQVVVSVQIKEMPNDIAILFENGCQVQIWSSSSKYPSDITSLPDAKIYYNSDGMIVSK